LAGTTLPGGTAGPAAAGGNSDSDYQTGIGIGAVSTSGTSGTGGNGLIVLSW
jgi:hypothetical protein